MIVYYIFNMKIQMLLVAQGFFHTAQLFLSLSDTCLCYFSNQHCMKQSSLTELSVASCSVFSHLHELKAVSVDLLYCCTQKSSVSLLSLIIVIKVLF